MSVNWTSRTRRHRDARHLIQDMSVYKKTGTPWLEMHMEKTRPRPLHDKDLFDLTLVKLFTAEIHGIPDLPVRRAYFLIQQHQPLPTIHTSVGQHHRIILDITLAMMGVGNISGELI